MPFLHYLVSLLWQSFGSRSLISFFLDRSNLCKNEALLFPVLSPCPLVSVEAPTQ